ncbi:MAG: DNA polymerase III subunit beta [Candidatus Pacebacteria bacterium]|nr:DNA polymerase III subunit beta [Candidatus Paceibacterota bacterium]
MKLILFRDNLKNGLLAAERAVADSSNLPILKNVLLRTIGNKIQLTTTNLELAITKLISGKIVEEGELSVPFATFYSIVNNTAHDRINLDREGSSFVVKTDNYEAKMQGSLAEDFPLIPRMEDMDHCMEIDPVVFQDALQQVISAAHISDIRPEISGVLFDFQMTTLKLVATDSFRLAEKIIDGGKFKNSFDAGFRAIVPLRTAQELLRVISRTTPLLVHCDANQILFRSDDVEIMSRLIDGNYPDYEQIIPKDAETEIILDRAHLINAVKLVSNFSGKTNDVRISTDADGKTVTVHSVNQFLGENKYLIPARVTGVQVTDIPFNWRYLLDGLKSISEESVVLKLNGSNRPALMRPTGDSSFVYIVMPIRV